MSFSVSVSFNMFQYVEMLVCIQRGLVAVYDISFCRSELLRAAAASAEGIVRSSPLLLGIGSMQHEAKELVCVHLLPFVNWMSRCTAIFKKHLRLFLLSFLCSFSFSMVFLVFFVLSRCSCAPSGELSVSCSRALSQARSCSRFLMFHVFFAVLFLVFFLVFFQVPVLGSSRDWFLSRTAIVSFILRIYQCICSIRHAKLHFSNAFLTPENEGTCSLHFGMSVPIRATKGLG